MCYKTHYKHTDKPPIFLHKTQQYLSARARLHIEMGLMTQNELVRAFQVCMILQSKMAKAAWRCTHANHNLNEY